MLGKKKKRKRKLFAAALAGEGTRLRGLGPHCAVLILLALGLFGDGWICCQRCISTIIYGINSLKAFSITSKHLSTTTNKLKHCQSKTQKH
jgi:hypothetical protein